MPPFIFKGDGNMERILSKQQQEYFKHSKIRDDKGSLISVYHGSVTKIEQFDPSYTGLGADSYGSGFYFSTDKEIANGYTTRKRRNEQRELLDKLDGEDNPSIMEVYLNLENPIYIDVAGKNENLSDVKIPQQAVADILRYLPTMYVSIDDEKENNPLGDCLDSIWEAYPVTKEDFDPYIEEYANKIMYDTNLRILDNLFIGYSTELRTALYDVLGYDGVVVDKGDRLDIVAWFPEQIKDVQNLYPVRSSYLMDQQQQETQSPDILRKIADRQGDNHNLEPQQQKRNTYEHER